MSNFKNNWIVMGYTLAGILAIICWPVTLMLLAVYIITKLCGPFFKGL